MSPQKGKSHKRSKSWHRGRSEARRWTRVRLPDLGLIVAYDGAPRALPEDGHTHKGEAL